MSEFQADLLAGLAVLLDAESIGTYRPTGAYEAGETAIVFGTLPQAPECAIALLSYPVEDDPDLSDSTLGVQVRSRWTGQDPRLVKDLSDKIFAQLHGKENFTLSTGITVVSCTRNSGGSLGQDTNNRWEWSDNYYLDLHRPSKNRT